MPRSLLLPVLVATLVACGQQDEGAAPTHATAGQQVAASPDDTRSPAGADRPVHRPEFEALAERIRRSDNPFLGFAQIDARRAHLARNDLEDQERLDTWAALALDLLRCGRVDEAVTEIDALVDHAEGLGFPRAQLLGLYRLRGLMLLRQAEVRNCVARHNADCCVFPIEGGGQHVDRDPAERAREQFLQCLEISPSQLDVRWLVNLLAMALGEYPDAVPEAHRIPPSVFESELDVGRFRDVAPDLGVDTFNQCGGVVVDDVDGDGVLDIVTSTFDPGGPLTLYLGGAGLAFEDASASSRLDDQLGGLNVLGADPDGDGDVDLLVLRGAWLYDDGQMRNSLLRNEGDGTFTDVTAELGLAAPARPTQAAVWFDAENDGDLDLFVGNESRMDADGTGDYPSQLFVQGADGVFQDRANAAGVTNDRYAKGVSAGDYDDDGDMDLYVSNVTANRLYRNEGALAFTDVGPELGVDEPRSRSFAPWFFDYDNDGRLDLFVGSYRGSVGDVAADVLGLPHQGELPRLFRNRGGTFEDVTAATELDHVWLPMGANFGDLDHDGWLDIYLATGDPEYQTLTPNVMLKNDEGRRFVDVTTSAGLGHLQKGHGVAFADIDDDGDQDIYNQLGGFYPGDGYTNALFLNPGHGHRFLYVSLTGTRSNRAGIGVRLSVTVETEDGGERTIHRAVGSVSSFGGSPRRQEIGLGDAVGIRRLELSWPASDTSQVLRELPLDSWIEITEGRSGFTVLPLHP